MRSDWDIIIIGSGAGGGTLAWQLAPSGRRILLVERGERVPREPDNWSSKAAVRHEKYHARDQWLDRHGNQFRPGTHYNLGGNTKFYGAALFRMREEDFGEVRHLGGVSPSWPIDYAELEPWYLRAERLFEVRGERGGDPTEPWSSGAYPAPAISHEPRIQALHDHFERKGFRPFHVPLGVRLDERDRAHSRCVRCATCDGYPCLVGAKADAETMCLDPAMRYGNLTVLTGARATRLLTDGSGRRVTRVEIERNGQIEQHGAEMIVVAAGAVNSAALLLRSASAAHPDGLANGSGMVGRHYMAHNNSVLFLFSMKRNPTRFQKTLALNDFYRPSAAAPYPLGHISMVGKFDGQMFKAGAPPLAPLPLLDAMGRHSLDFWLTSEDLPDPRNRVTLSGDGRIALDYTENNLRPHRELLSTLKRLLNDFDGGRWLSKSAKIPLAGVAHQCGTLRFGDDPATSVLDRECRAHEVENLWVVDGSFFPSSSAVNPALTIIANALRVGDRLLDRLGVRQEQRHAHPIERLPVLA